MRLNITNCTTNDVFGIRQDRVIAGGSDTPRLHALLRFASALRYATYRLSGHQMALSAHLESEVKRCWRRFKCAAATMAGSQSAVWQQSAVPVVVMPSVTTGPPRCGSDGSA